MSLNLARLMPQIEEMAESFAAEAARLRLPAGMIPPLPPRHSRPSVEKANREWLAQHVPTLAEACAPLKCECGAFCLVDGADLATKKVIHTCTGCGARKSVPAPDAHMIQKRIL